MTQNSGGGCHGNEGPPDLMIPIFLYCGVNLLVRTHGIRRLSSTTQPDECPVCSHNEWDPLEEVIVGRVEGSAVPPFSDAFKPMIEKRHWPFFEKMAGKPFPEEVTKKATVQIEELCNILRHEGVTVRRPEIIDFTKNGPSHTDYF
ncbi:Glycine amidinotransferase, mitochondrial [Exaiptasia diaphana]|nr:Glycine amidinotransferase, mitochondrial [Exaiptasia diaphana]